MQEWWCEMPVLLSTLRFYGCLKSTAESWRCSLSLFHEQQVKEKSSFTG